MASDSIWFNSDQPLPRIRSWITTNKQVNELGDVSQTHELHPAPCCSLYREKKKKAKKQNPKSFSWQSTSTATFMYKEAGIGFMGHFGEKDLRPWNNVCFIKSTSEKSNKPEYDIFFFFQSMIFYSVSVLTAFGIVVSRNSIIGNKNIPGQPSDTSGWLWTRERERMSSFIPCGQREAIWVGLPEEHLQRITSVTPGALGWWIS